MILHDTPAKLPGKGIHCLYLYHKETTAKIGMSTNLKLRDEEHRLIRHRCIAYLEGVSDLKEAEKRLIAFFGERFPKARPSGEWLTAEREEAHRAFTEFAKREMGQS